MSFIDMAFLKKTDLQNGYLKYRRHKTKQQLLIRWEKCMQEILSLHPTDKASPYLLPIVKQPYDNARKCYRNTMASINVQLKKIAELTNVAFPLSLYCARHSWASIAHSKNIPISIISEGMGHDSEATTLIYLASIDNTTIDNANAKILKDL